MTAAAADEYPEHLLAREAAPPYTGEGPFALWHFSEDPSLGLFAPRAVLTDPDGARLVWTVDTRHAPMFWFPRDCYWTAEEPVEAAERVTFDDLLGQHAEAGIELRVTPSIWPFWRRVVASTLAFSGSRLRNAADHPERVA